MAESPAIKIGGEDGLGVLVTDSEKTKERSNSGFVNLYPTPTPNYVIEEGLRKEEDYSGTVNPSQEEKIDSFDSTPGGQVKSFASKDKKGYTNFSGRKGLKIQTDV